MNAYRARRATTDDLPKLVAIWQSLQMPAMELERHFTDFQVAEDADGSFAGAIALQVVNGEGLIHSETIPDFSLADAIRPVFWDRIQSAARNRGLMRLWTIETALFWKKDAGFSEPSAERLQHLPAAFGERRSGWLVLQLRGDEASPEALQRQVDLIAAEHAAELKASQLKAQDWARKGKALSVAALTLAAILFLAAIVFLFKVKAH